MKPDEFWKLTPHEFYLYSKGAIERENEEWQRTAQLTSWLLQAWVKDGPSADRLLGKEKTQEMPHLPDAESYHEYMRSRDK